MWAITQSSNSCAPSKEKLQRQLDHPGTEVGLDLSEIGRTDVAIGQPEISMVQEIEKLSPELKFFSLCHLNILERGKIPIHVSRPLHDIVALVTEYLESSKRIGSEFLEGAYVEPFLWVCGPLFGFPIKLGRFAEKPVISGAPPWRELSDESNTVKGVPLMKVAMPFSCQSPSTCSYQV